MSDSTPLPDTTGDLGGDSRVLTWAALLGKWTELARAAVALPPGDRWRSAVAPAIELQAVACALSEVDQLPTDERALAHDRAAVVVDRAEAALGGLWPDGPLPVGLSVLIEDARTALAAARVARD